MNASLDLALGLVLIASAGIVELWGRQRSSQGGDDRASGTHVRAAFPFGVFSMATNFTTLALIVPAAKEISSADLEVAEKGALAALLVALASSPAWVPVVLVWVAPDPGRRVLDAAGTLVARYGRAAVVLLLAAGGIFFAGRGLIRLVG